MKFISKQVLNNKKMKYRKLELLLWVYVKNKSFENSLMLLILTFLINCTQFNSNSLS